MKRKWLAIDLPLTDYGQAQVLQERCVAAKTDGRLPEDLMFLLEHPAVFTLGRNGGRENPDGFRCPPGVGRRRPHAV
jgi:lipoate-protein ligase B